MTGAQPKLAAVPGLQWHCNVLGAEMVCTPDVLERVRSEVVQGFCLMAHSGLETGGILFGRQTGPLIEIIEARPIECEHKFGPSFLLSEKDEELLRGVLENARTDPRPQSLRPVGLYLSHARRGFSVAEADARILSRYFPDSINIALILMPTKAGSARAGFFVRGPDGGPEYSCGHELLLTPPESRPGTRRHHGSMMPDLGKPVGKDPVAVEENRLAAPPVNTIESPSRIEDALENRWTPALRWLSASRWELVAGVVLLLLCLPALTTLRPRTAGVPLTRVPIRITPAGSQLRIEWDPALETVLTATEGLFEIRDGVRDPVQLRMSRDALREGSLIYGQRPDKVEVRLKLIHRDGPPSESIVYFVNPESSAPPAAEAKAMIASKPAKVENTTPVPAKLTPPTVASTQELPKPSQTQQEVSRQIQREPEQQLQPEQRVFRLPEQRPTIAGLETVAALPEAPPIQIVQTSSALLPPSTLALGSKGNGVNGPRSGRLIWTGELRKGATVRFSMTGASQGVLNGRLPGSPVEVLVQPAEVIEDGIAILTKDRARDGTSVPSGSRNGWKLIIYKWAAKGIPEVNIVEPPSPANEWKQLVLRNGNRNLAVVVVDWELTPR